VFSGYTPTVTGSCFPTFSAPLHQHGISVDRSIALLESLMSRSSFLAEVTEPYALGR